MSNDSFILQSCTKAIADSSDAAHLLEQKGRLEQAVSGNDAALTLDTSKALLETVFKTILKDRVIEPRLNQDLKPMYAAVREALPLSHDSQANQILKNLTNGIVHNVAELRNKYGAASHGDDGYYESPIEMPEAEMIAHVVDGMAGFLYRRHKDLNDPTIAQRIHLTDHPEFNDWLDTQNNSIPIITEGSKPILYSKFLYDQDREGYRAALLQYQNSEIESELEIVTKAEIELSSPRLGLSVGTAIGFAATGAQLAGPIGWVASPILYGAVAISEKRKLSKAINDVAQTLEQDRLIGSLINSEQSRDVARFVCCYARDEAGLDWQKREALVAKFRLKIKQQLLKSNYPKQITDQAVALLVKKAKEHYPSREYSVVNKVG